MSTDEIITNEIINDGPQKIFDDGRKFQIAYTAICEIANINEDEQYSPNKKSQLIEEQIVTAKSCLFDIENPVMAAAMDKLMHTKKPEDSMSMSSKDAFKELVRKAKDHIWIDPAVGSDEVMGLLEKAHKLVNGDK